jgi:nucleoside-diphosphate-sugar epimerase
MHKGKATILGINGHIGHHVAKAFVAAGWDVTGFGRSNRHPVAGVGFVAGDAESVAEMRAAIGDSAVVVNALNLPYHQWDKGRMEAQTARVIEAVGTSGRTMLFPGNIYNYSPGNPVLTPDLPQVPPTPRGQIRKRIESMLGSAAAAGDMQVIILRAGDFFGPESSGDWFDQVILREAGKRRAAILGRRGTGHSWAYLPDLGRAFEKLAWHRKELGGFENFHFAGHYITPEQLAAAITATAPVPLKVSRFPWVLLSLLGLADPVLREVAKMGYLWQQPIALRDPRLEAILGPNFGTSLEEAMAETVRPHFAAAARQAA